MHAVLQDKRVLRMEKLEAAVIADYGLAADGDWWAVQVRRPQKGQGWSMAAARAQLHRWKWQISRSAWALMQANV